MDGDRHRLTEVVNLREERYDVFIGRPSKWGNPFRIGVDGDRDRVLGLYAEYLLMNPRLREEAVQELAGKRLGCFCRPLPCHGDILAMLANRDW